MTSAAGFRAAHHAAAASADSPRHRPRRPLRAYSDRNEDLLSRLFCATARDDALAPAGILGAARNLRPSRSVGGTMPMHYRSSNAERRASRYHPSKSHGKNQSWRPHICARSDSLTVPKAALGTRLTVATCRVTTLAELPNCKLSPRANRSTEQALPYRQMHIKSVIPVRTFRIYTEQIASLLRIPHFIVAVQLRINVPRKTRNSFERG